LLKSYLKVFGIKEIALVVPTDNSIGEEASRFGVRVIVCPSNATLYGEKLQYALDRIDTDIVIITEAD
jgi:hypothetical protein